MNYYDKKEFLEHCKETARNLEWKTGKFYEIQIGWIHHMADDLPVTIMLNHPSRWFGSFEKLGWNEQVIWDNVGKFIPVDNDYLVLNELIDEVYNE